jgi:hypothetical protein
VIIVREVGDWGPGRVVAQPVASTRATIAHVEAAIDAAWAAASARLGSRLFDGPMLRLERCEASPQLLRLWVSPTSYRPFLGTNLANPDAAPQACANPIGLSAALVTRDGWLMLGRRNARVAYHPNRIHPFAGSLEPGEVSDVFAGVLRELDEELRFTPADVADLRCIGLIEDARIRQPELIFAARSTRTRADVESMVDAAEHHACVAVATTPEAIEGAMADALLTPVAVGTLLLWGRLAFGERWFHDRRSAVEINPPSP